MQLNQKGLKSHLVFKRPTTVKLNQLEQKEFNYSSLITLSSIQAMLLISNYDHSIAL